MADGTFSEAVEAVVVEAEDAVPDADDVAAGVEDLVAEADDVAAEADDDVAELEGVSDVVLVTDAGKKLVVDVVGIVVADSIDVAVVLAAADDESDTGGTVATLVLADVEVLTLLINTISIYSPFWDGIHPTLTL